jgi:hypothetical protein
VLDELGGQLVDLYGQRAGAFDQAAGQACHQHGRSREVVVVVAESNGDLVVGADPVERARSRIPAGVELVQVPAQPVDDAGAFGDQRFAVIAQQAHVAVRAVETRGGQVGLAQHGTGHGQGVDRVGLAERSGRITHVGHQLGWNPSELLTGGE